MPEQIINEITVPAALQEFDWRAASKADVPLIFALKLACDEADGTEFAGTEDLQAREFDDAWIGNPANNTLLALTARGDAAAFGAVFANPEPENKRQAFLELNVHPRQRGAGLEGFLFRQLERIGRRVLAEIDADLPAVLRYVVDDTVEDEMALVEKYGFQPVRHFYRMRRDLQRPVDVFPLPAGLSLQPYRPEYELPLWEAFNEAFADHWNFEPATLDDWQRWIIGTEDFRPDLSYLVMDGAEIAGFAVNEVRPEENQRYGISQGWIKELGTRRPWRRQGIASALLAVSMQAFKAAGLDYAALAVDTENPTGALGLYERLGFEPVRRFIAYEKPV